MNQKQILFLLGLFAALAGNVCPAAGDLEWGRFETPPVENRPETWFHIIGGNVTREGITADLEAIADAGIRGIQFFHGQFGGPWPNVPKQIVCLSPEWDSLVAFTADECKRLGLSFKMQNCPGWSMSGGPWITPATAMRELVYSRADVEVVNGQFSVQTHPARDPRNADLDYKDVAVLAFPTPEGDLPGELKPAKDEVKGLVHTLTYDHPVTVRSFTVPDPNGLNHAYAYNIDTQVKLEAIAPDGTAKVVRIFDYPQGNWHRSVPMTLACDETTAAKWRVTFTTKRPIRTPWVRLSSSARFDNWEGRAGWTLCGLGWELNDPKQTTATRVKTEAIIDLTSSLASDGTVSAPLPKDGRWTILRFGHVNMCLRNGPAPAEGTGWECDKLDPRGAEAQYAGYIGRLAKGPLAGGKLAGVLLDSWECSRQTWTWRMEEYFRQAKGYPLRKYLPAIFGWVLDTPAKTDTFLLDWRNLISSLIEENFYRRMSDLAHRDGLEIQYETAFGDVIPGDILKFWKYADTPMAEFWAPHRNDGYVGDHDFKPVVPCVSAAHIYGKKRVAAEAFTSFELTWNENFRLLKNVGNKHFARGVTHCVFHTYTHNPQVDWKRPGTSFGTNIGTPFLRGQTWWPYMRSWTDYLSRINVMLEEGRPCADILRYLGDYVGHKPSEHEEPFGNRFKEDYLNPDGLMTRLSVKDGRWTLPDGTSYTVLWLPPETYLTDESRARIDALEQAGGRVVRTADPTADLTPDVSDGGILWNHRTDGHREWYFVTAKAEGFKGPVTFRAKGGAEIWDPVTGSRHPAARAGDAVVLDLASDEAVFVVFDPSKPQAAEADKPATAQARVGAWTLALGKGAARPLADFDAWKELPGLTDEEKAFAGTGTYRTTVTVEKTGSCLLDLGRVEAWAEVRVNGKKVTTLWCEPYRCEIGPFLKLGANELRIDVTSAWHNRLVYDAGLPEEQRETWVLAGPGAGSALRAAGLMGPVSLTADAATLKHAHAGQTLDRSTKGDWFTVYGSEGCYLIGGENPASDRVSLPAYVESVTFDLGDGRSANRSSGIRPRDPEARLTTQPCWSERHFACCYSALHGTLYANVNLREQRPYTVALYVADCDGGGRAMEVDAFDVTTSQRIAPMTSVTDFGGGVYLVYSHNQSLRFRLACVGGDNAVLNALFFGEPKTADQTETPSSLTPVLTRRSPASQPYPYVDDGAEVTSAVAASPDPLAAYQWKNPSADSTLQVYVALPERAEDRMGKGVFTGLETVTSETCAVRVNGAGTLRIDFGVELPAWLEIDSPDLSGDVTLGVSEHREVQSFPGHKTAKPVKYGDKTYRLELNRELYEGVRFAFVNVTRFDKPFTITAIRAMTQVMPCNYTGSFISDNPMLNRIWYVAAWDVRANLREDSFGAILMDRGDRYSWTGDAYTAQAASLTAFSNYGAVLKNLRFTESHRNGIESYELYWIESLIDYYMYSGDAVGVRSLLQAAYGRLDHAAQIFDNPTHLAFVGWDERTGIGFDHPDCDQNKLTYQMLAIGAWKHFAETLDRLGETAQATKYRNLAAAKTAAVLSDPKYLGRLGMHASADAINAGLIEDTAKLYHPDLSDRLQRLSYSPFNQCFLLQAMAAAGRYDDAFASVMDMWGGQISYGGTCFFEVYHPDWNDILGKNGPIPFTQSGHTSLAHPWGAAVLTWLSEEMLGIKPVEPGFSRFAVVPHFNGHAKRVAGRTMTPHGAIDVSFDLNQGRHTLVVPPGARATFAIPKEGMAVKAITAEKVDPARIRPTDDFVYIDDLAPGEYTFTVQYEGTPKAAVKESYRYAAACRGVDRSTYGNWHTKYGKDGYFIVGGGENNGDLADLPDYVESVSFDHLGNPAGHRSTDVTPFDERATLPTRRDGTGPRVFGCYYSSGLQMCPVDIKLKRQHPYTVTLYMADCKPGPGGRDQNIDAFDLETLNRIAPTVRVNNMEGGVYATFTYNRSIRFRCNNIRGDNAVINAVFFEPAPQVLSVTLSDSR